MCANASERIADARAGRLVNGVDAIEFEKSTVSTDMRLPVDRNRNEMKRQQLTVTCCISRVLLHSRRIPRNVNEKKFYIRHDRVPRSRSHIVALPLKAQIIKTRRSHSKRHFTRIVCNSVRHNECYDRSRCQCNDHITNDK